MPEPVTLRPVGEDDLPLLRTLTQDPRATGEFEQVLYSILRTDPPP
jgi:hypothetical protein